MFVMKQLSMIRTIAGDSIYGYLKNRLLWGVVFFFLLFSVIIALNLPQITRDYESVFPFVNGFFSSIGSLLSLAIFVHFVPRRLDGREVFLYYSRPVSRFAFFAGRVVGAGGMLLLYIILKSIVEMGLGIHLMGEGVKHISFLGFAASGLMLWVWLMVYGLEVLWLRLLNMSAVFVVILVFLVSSHWGIWIRSLYEDSKVLAAIGAAIYIILPDAYTNCGSWGLYGVETGDLLKGLAYCLSWLLFFFFASLHRYRWRNLKTGGE